MTYTRRLPFFQVIPLKAKPMGAAAGGMGDAFSRFKILGASPPEIAGFRDFFKELILFRFFNIFKIK